MNRLFNYVKHKKHIIFDYNGTILYDTEVCVDTLNQILKKLSIKPISVAEYRNKFHFPIREFYKEMGIDLEKVNFEELSQSYYQSYKENIDRCEIYEGLIDLVKDLKKVNTHVSILTALNQNELFRQLKHFQILELFDDSFGLEDYQAHSKIQRGHDLMNHVGIATEDTLMIGDTCHDWEVAQALNIEILLLSDGHQTEERLLKKSQNVVTLNRRL